MKLPPPPGRVPQSRSALPPRAGRGPAGPVRASHRRVQSRPEPSPGSAGGPSGGEVTPRPRRGARPGRGHSRGVRTAQGLNLPLLLLLETGEGGQRRGGRGGAAALTERKQPVHGRAAARRAAGHRWNLGPASARARAPRRHLLPPYFRGRAPVASSPRAAPSEREGGARRERGGADGDWRPRERQRGRAAARRVRRWGERSRGGARR